LVFGEVPQLYGSQLYVVIKEVLGLLGDQGILGIRNGALVVLSDGGVSGDGGVVASSHKLAEVESLLGGVSRRVVLGFTCGLGHASLMFGLVAVGPASASEEIARTGLACAICRLPCQRRQSL
jgi:hypothetical protein